MIIKEKVGNLNNVDIAGRMVDKLSLEWHETSKRIIHKQTVSGQNIILKFLNEVQQLEQDDVLYADVNIIIAIDILPCETIVIKPASMYQMALVCYEIGNKHLPLFYEASELLLPYEAPLFRLLQGIDIEVERQHRKLLRQLRTSVPSHEHHSSESLLFKVLKLTTSTNAK